jgi:uncharacterized short protein YbdD (DUF466 family)
MPKLKNTIDLNDVEFVRNALRSAVGRTEDSLAHVRVSELHSVYVQYMRIVRPSRPVLTYRPFFKVLRMLDLKIKGRGTPVLPCVQNIAKLAEPILYYGLNHEDNGKVWNPNFQRIFDEKHMMEISKIRSESAKKSHERRRNAK